MPQKSDNRLVKDLIRDKGAELTRTERQLADTLFRDYPIIGLQSITKLAAQAGVSTPTVVRLARKLGFDGFPALQDALHAEAAEQMKTPGNKHQNWHGTDDDDHILSRMGQAVSTNLNETMKRLDRSDFNKVATILSDPKREIYLVGGRITRSNADYFFNHLQILRPGVHSISQSQNVWPQYLLDMNENTVLIIFDIRRYERDVYTLAELAKERGATVILFTDQWGSPISRFCEAVFNAHVEAPSSWDSTIAIMFIVEALVALVNFQMSKESSARLEELESMFTTTRLFRRFGSKP